MFYSIVQKRVIKEIKSKELKTDVMLAKKIRQNRILIRRINTWPTW
jgi:hypothetical protein